MKTAFLFPGQGAQTLGMGRDIAQAYHPADEIYDKANNIVGFDIKKICFEGPQEKLNTTEFSQPAIFVTSAAILEVLKSHKPTLTPDVTAGLSLGEYTALYAAGLISFKDAMLLVKQRGQAMQQAAEKNAGSMVSIIGLEEEKVRLLCEKAAQGELLEPVNFNCPGQIVISGSKTACQRAEKLATELGAIKAIPLKVAGAFHTEMMESAARRLEQALQNCNISQPKNIKVISNITAEHYHSSEDIFQGLTKQLTQPILWQQSMQRLIAYEVDEFYEIGPGKVLTGLMKRIDRKKNITNISNKSAIEKLLTT